MAAKRLGLLHELVPKAKAVWLCWSTLANAGRARSHVSGIVTGSRPRHPARANRGRQGERPTAEIEAAFAALARDCASMRCSVGGDGFLTGRHEQIVALASRDAIPAVYAFREFADAGGLMSYGTDIPESFRQVGVYAGQILKSAKPADLAMPQSTKFEFVINMQNGEGARPRGAAATLLARPTR